jgi:Uma2 family endonuclease
VPETRAPYRPTTTLHEEATVAATEPLEPGDPGAPAPAPVPLPVRSIHVYDHPLTLEEFLALPDSPSGRGVELRHGRVVEVSPSDNLQGAVQDALYRRLIAYVDAHGGDACGFLRPDMGFVVDPEGPVPVRFPDLAFLRAARLPDPYASGFLPGAPDLAVEIAGRHDYLPELRRKARAYLAAGAALVWVLVPPHPGRRVRVVVWTADGRERMQRATEELVGDPVLPGFRVRPAELWAR